jgi:hypothetical protein
MSPSFFAWSHQSLVAAAGPAGAASEPLAAASALLLASEVLLVVVLVELLPHAVSTSAAALIPAIAAVNFFVGLWVTRPTSVSQVIRMCM